MTVSCLTLKKHLRKRTRTFPAIISSQNRGTSSAVVTRARSLPHARYAVSALAMHPVPLTQFVKFATSRGRAASRPSIRQFRSINSSITVSTWREKVRGIGSPYSARVFSMSLRTEALSLFASLRLLPRYKGWPWVTSSQSIFSSFFSNNASRSCLSKSRRERKLLNRRYIWNESWDARSAEKRGYPAG